MPLGLSISPASDVPIFRQIMHQIQRAISARALRVGEQLPAVRSLAESLVINPTSVRYVAGFGRAMSLTAQSVQTVMGDQP